jgi:hypothetical protein
VIFCGRHTVNEMANFAQGTRISSGQTENEIRNTLKKFGASKYAYYEDDERIGFSFDYEDRRVRIVVEMPDPADDDFVFVPSRREKRSEKAKFEFWQKECNRRWRALAFTIKAKLVTVTEGIRTFEQEFLYDIVLPNNQTVGEYVVPQIRQAYLQGKMPPLLPGVSETTTPED